ncbi:MAG: RhuM family protein [Alphaproteobacteria bacterium]|jgi:hypothetical protein|nr:RhuM family protein [Alphaproteobacteria bacterium]
MSDNIPTEPVHLVEDAETGDKFLIYGTERGIQVELRYESDTLWMTQAQMSNLFGRDVSVISRHVSKIISDGELPEESNLQKMQIASSDRPVTLYSLDMIISVGYRVSSKQGTMFRKWATDTLVQFATKGFVVDADRLKDPDNTDHFAELREIIRDIRASEANVYKEVRNICALCSDYTNLSEHEKNVFFAKVQNKLHHAVTNMTGAEIRVSRADAKQQNMGLTTWSGDRPTQKDVLTAKNFLGDAEIRDLNRFTGMLLDYFEQETDLQRLVVMADAEEKLDRFIRNNERPLLQGRGGVSKKAADQHAKRQYEIFNEQRRLRRHAEADEALEALKAQATILPKSSE